MKVCLVRHVESKDFQGLFWGKTLADIYDEVDAELADPYRFEYAFVDSGGLFTRAPIGKARRVPQFDDHEDVEDTEEFDWSGFVVSETLSMKLYDMVSLRWQRFDRTDTGVGLLARAQARRLRGSF